MTTIKDIAEAFSDQVPAGVQTTLEGRDAIVAACENTVAELAGSTTTFSRFVSVADVRTVAVDAVARYVDAAGRTSVVSSCDIYEFDDDTLVAITSYAVELPEE